MKPPHISYVYQPALAPVRSLCAPCYKFKRIRSPTVRTILLLILIRESEEKYYYLPMYSKKLYCVCLEQPHISRISNSMGTCINAFVHHAIESKLVRGSTVPILYV